MIIPVALENFVPLLHVDALPVVARELSRSARRQLDQLHLDKGSEQHQLHLQQDVDKLQLKQAGEHDQLHLDQGAHPDLEYSKVSKLILASQRTLFGVRRVLYFLMLELTLHGDKIRIRSDQVEERVDMASPWTVQLQRDICRRALWRSRRCARLQDQFVKRQLI